MTRKYELKKRAEGIAATRQRIVDAAVALHTTRGPAVTTLSAIADRAGVQRHTLYAHFPDMRSLFEACSAHWDEQHPMPDLEPALRAADPAARLRGVLQALYAWYAEVEDDLAIFVRDGHVFPEFHEAAEADRVALRDALAQGRSDRTRAAVGHALEFETWRSFVRREGLSPDAAVDLAVELAFG